MRAPAWFFIALAGAAVAGLPLPAIADRNGANLMSMDHVLLEADFIGRVRVASLSQAVSDDENPSVDVSLEVLDAWSSRWSDSDALEFTMRTGTVVLEEGRQYVVLISGGPFRGSPFTHRDNSVFEVNDQGEVHCANSLPLFGVMPDGFLCSVQPLVLGSPIDLSEMERQTERARLRAADRHPELARRLDTASRPLVARFDATATVAR